jgi:O-antigen ligase
MIGHYAGLGRRFLALSLPPFSVNPKLHGLIWLAITISLGLAISLLPLRIAILGVSGAIALTALLIRPVLALYLLIPLIPFSSLLAISRGEFKVGLMEVVLALGLLAWLLRILASPRFLSEPLKLRTGPLLWPFGLFLGAIGLSWLGALSLEASLVETAKWVEMFSLYLFIINLLPVGQVKWTALALMVAGTAQALLGLYQFIFKAGPEGFLLFEGQFLRAYGTFAQPNPYAGYLGLVLPLALSLTIWGLTNNLLARSVLTIPARLFKVALFGIPLVLMLAALFASQSRGAWLGFAAAALTVLFVRGRTSAILLTAVVMLGALFGLVSSFEIRLPQAGATQVSSAYSVVVQRLADAISVMNISDVAATEVTDANFANIERLAHWQAAREMWHDHLWVGVGFGNYAVAYPAYAAGRWLDPLGHAHNYFLNIGAETGLIGIISYLIFWIFSFGLLWRVIQHSDDFYKAVAAGGLGVMVHLHIHNFVDNLYVQGMYLHLAVILGLVSVIHNHYKNSPTR